MKKTTRTAITNAQVAALAREAAEAGDEKMVKICGRALSGNAAARKECERVIYAARAMREGA
jgi:hypothetical protein